jgi:voltage-gated potassium channel
MLVLSLVYIALFATEVISTGLNSRTLSVINIVSNIIWISFILDLAVRTYLAPERIQYLLKHPVDVLSVVLPAFRALRALRVITAGQWILTRGSQIAIGRTASAIVAGAALLAGIGALAVLDAEKNDPASSIHNFGEALWWAFVTMSTVGYGDVYPVTFNGRVVAVMMMIAGVSLVGIVSATLASALLAKLRGIEAEDSSRINHRIDVLETKIDDLTSLIHAMRVEIATLRKPSPSRRPEV